MLPAAASVSLAPVLSGPVRTVTVAASLSRALYLRTPDAESPALCLASADAVRVPCAVVLGPGVAVPAAAVGATASVGEGRLEIGDVSVAVTRWWRPARPRVHLLSSDARQRALRGPAPHFGTDLDLGDPAGAVRTLLGRGAGLTPLGDDVLAGALVTLTAARHPAGQVLGSVVSEELAARPGATTFVSAALLAQAARGECIPELAAVLTDPADRLEPTVDALLRVGHSSGLGLLHGVRMALSFLTEAEPKGSQSDRFAPY
ncbi:DUF2877 domain-containing protein [Cryptosporangium aurantiacum]|uniref:DUF2877 domain-containing protein n=1 Tax=Cryptosporangium aurantiacum TaxID=134849 RepID=A0A1M7N8Q7_9ACTN|nr:DUF2877 domain-containing protein [Cryptosporangium aurantiacum]SHM99921.1 Protein of unknown function [Cryptosporangium aurantiacum]